MMFIHIQQVCCDSDKSGLGIMKYPLYNPDLAPSDFFEPMKVYLGGHRVQTDDEFKCSVLLNWLCC
jgi:hypothetical protein